MSFLYTVARVQNRGKYESDIDGLLSQTRGALRSVAQTLQAALLTDARRRAGGGAQQPRTGRHLQGIKGRESATPSAAGGSVYSSVPGAGMLETGGRLPARDIMPTRGKALAFMGSVGTVFASVVHVPEAIVAPHSAIHAAFDEMRGKIVQGLTSAGSAVWN